MNAVAVAKTLRPYPPEELLQDFAGEMFAPDARLAAFVDRTFLNDLSPLWNEDHGHLLSASIGYLWTNVVNTRQQKRIMAMAEMPKPPLGGHAWAKAKHNCQMREWFGMDAEDSMDFLITIDANYAATADDIAFCTLIDHELYHCSQAIDEFGEPKFKKDGAPVFSIKGHDSEEFVGVVRRYGTGAAAGMIAELVDAARNGPEIAGVDVTAVCGSCG